ncbi:hypothetical protein LguiA_018616 [Lonicera macranthoides]
MLILRLLGCISHECIIQVHGVVHEDHSSIHTTLGAKNYGEKDAWDARGYTIQQVAVDAALSLVEGALFGG